MSELSTFVEQASKLCQSRQCEEVIGVLEEAAHLDPTNPMPITNSDSVTGGAAVNMRCVIQTLLCSIFARRAAMLWVPSIRFSWQESSMPWETYYLPHRTF